MKEKIEKLLKSHLKRKLTITTATLIAFLLPSNLAMAEQKYQVGNGKIERDDSGTWENATEYLGSSKTGLFEISETNIVNRLKDLSSFTLLSEVNKPFINEGKIRNLTNNGTGEIENRGSIWNLNSATENEVENKGYIDRFTSKGNITNKGYIYSIEKAKNIVNDVYIYQLNENEKITNNGFIQYIKNGANIEEIKNNGIIYIAQSAYDTIDSNKIKNEGIVFVGGNFKEKAVNTSEIENYHDESIPIPNSIIDKKILNAYKGRIRGHYNGRLQNNLEVKNSILNMREGVIEQPAAGNKKIIIDNSTVNMERVRYYTKLELEFKNNSKIGRFNIQGRDIKSLTMDNTTEVGDIFIGGDIEAINLVSNEANRDKVLRIISFNTQEGGNINTYISTNVDLLERGNLGNITVKEGGILTIAKDTLISNGAKNEWINGKLVPKYYKKDITIKKGGKIIIVIDPYNIGQIEKLGDGNNLTESVIGQKDTNIASERLPRTKLNLLADSRLHGIVVLDAREIKYLNAGISRVKNEYIVVEELNLPIPGPDKPKPTDAPELNSVYQDLQKAGGVKYLKVGNDEQVFGLYEYLRDMYANSPYALSAETSFRNLAMLRDNAYLDLKPNLNKWAVMGGLSHSDRENKFKHKLGTTEADTITTGAYAKGEYGLKEDTTLGLILGGTNSKSDLLTGKVKGSSIYLGAYAKKYVNNFKFTLGTGIDLGEYKVDRNAIGYAGIIETEKYSAKQKNRAFDLYAEARYSKDLGNNFYLEPNFNLAYSRVRQGGATEKDGKINLDIKSKTFNQTTAALGLDLKKVLLSGNTSHSFALGTAYERVLSGAKENSLRASFVGGSGSGFDILVPEKEKGRTSIGAEYNLENKVGILFNLKMDYGFKHGSDKKDIRFSTGLGYRF